MAYTGFVATGRLNSALVGRCADYASQLPPSTYPCEDITYSPTSPSCAGKLNTISLGLGLDNILI